MYDELVKELREAEKEAKELFANPYRFVPYYGKAADAIERLSRECKVLYAMLGTHPDPRGEIGDSGDSWVLREPPKEEI